MSPTRLRFGVALTAASSTSDICASRAALAAPLSAAITIGLILDIEMAKVARRGHK
jgi:hypothetical protein